MKNQQPEKSNTWKFIVVAIVIMAAGGWTYLRARSVTPGAVANNGQTEEFQRPSPEEMQATMKAAAAYAGLSTTQTAAMEKRMEEARTAMENRRPGDRPTSGTRWARPADGSTSGPRRTGGGFTPGQPSQPGAGGGRGGGGFMMGGGAGGNEIMSDEQRGKMREFMATERTKREEKVKNALTGPEFERYQQKQAERRASRGGRGGTTGGR